MVNFNELPFELLEHIISFVAQQDLATQGNFALTCKRAKSRMESRLRGQLQTLEFRAQELPILRRQLFDLLIAILHCPWLTQFTHTVHLSTHAFTSQYRDDSEDDEDPISMTSTDTAMLGRALKHVRLFQEYWAGEVAFGNTDVLAALLLLLLPNLQSLVGDDLLDAKYITRVIHDASTQSPPAALMNLRTLQINYWTTEGACMFRDLWRFLDLPALERLRIQELYSNTRRSAEKLVPAGPRDILSITKIEIYGGAITALDMDSLFRRTPNLQVLRIVGNKTIVGPYMRVPELNAALRHVKSSLQDLKVIYEEGCIDRVTLADLAGGETPVIALAENIQLRCVELSMSLLLREEEDPSYHLNDFLPLSLEHFTVHIGVHSNSLERLYDALVGMLIGDTKRLSCLLSLTLKYKQKILDPTRVQLACNDAGVELIRSSSTGQ